MKFSWSMLAQVLFAHAVPLLQKTVSNEKVTKDDVVGFAVNSFLAYASISGSLPKASAAGEQVSATFAKLNEASHL